MKYEIVTGGADRSHEAIPLCSFSAIRWQKRPPLAANLFSSLYLPPFYSALPQLHLWIKILFAQFLFNPSTLHLGYYLLLPSFFPSSVTVKDTCGIAGGRVLRFDCAWQRGASLVWHGAITHTHTLRVPLEVNVTEGAPTVPGNRFLSHFISRLSPLYIIEKATQQCTLGSWL